VERRTRRWAPYAIAAASLAIGYVNVARCVPHAGLGYRPWSFAHHCYTDVLSMGSDRYYGGSHPVPYLQDRVEYPVLLGLALWLPSLAGGPGAHLALTALFLAVCLGVTLAALQRLPGVRPLWLAATPALPFYAFLNWDLLPIALLSLALLALARDRPGAGGALAGFGVAAKLFPAVLAPAALPALAAGRNRRAALAFAVAGTAAIVAVNLPVAAAAPEGWSWFFRYNAGRGAENSAWDALHVASGPLLEALSAGPLLAASALAAVCAWRAARAGGDAARALRLGTAMTLVVWIATNKVWSPQYALYGFLAGALAAAPGWLWGTLSVISVVDFHVAFETRARGWEPGFRDAFFYPDALLRTVLWLILAGWIARELLSAPTTGAVRRSQ
jgi:hypothetical protein